MTTLSEHKLSPTQISALVVLMAEARPLSNPEMKELAGFDLTGTDRAKLNDLGLISSAKQGRSFVHELSDAGWRRIGELFQIDAIRGIGPTRGALKVLLSALDRGFRRQHKAVGDFFYSGALSTPDLEQEIRLAYKGTAKSPGEWVRLSLIRAALASASRAEVDATLTRMATQADVRIIPIANLKSLSQEDKSAAVELGGEFKHAMAIEG